MTNKSMPPRQRFHSVFVKLFLTMMLLGALLLGISAVFLNYFADTRWRPQFEKHHHNYAVLLIRQLGMPPEREKAVETARVHGVDIRYENGAVAWATAEDMPSVRETIKEWAGESPGTGVFSAGLYHTVIVDPEGGAYLFKWDFPGALATSLEHILLFLSFVFIVFVGAYLFIRNLLKPLKLLGVGVNRISGGHLDVQVPVRRNDELGFLTEAFNAMALRIREMITARDQLLVDVSHELRSPITRIKLGLEFIPDGQKKQNIRADLGEIETMITEILETERLKDGYGKLHLETADLAALVRDAAAGFDGRAPGIDVAGVAGSLMWEIDTWRVKLVLQNVLENALKYSAADAPPVRLNLKKEGDRAVIEIRDHGEGIPETELPYVFEPFYRVDRSRSRESGGYGLGLSLCKKIMDAHHGAIRLKKNPGDGVTVTLRFPRHTD